MKILAGKRALVTGASRGIGQQCAVALAKTGCNVIIHASKPENLERTEHLLADCEVTVTAIAADLGDPGSVAKMLAELDETYPAVDIVYNNAAVSCDPQPDFIIDRQLLDRIMEVNIYSLMTICNHFIPKMQEAGFGRIVNFTSGITRRPELEPYAISKAAVDKYTEDMAVLLEGSDVLMNTITPGWVRTDMGGPEAVLSPQEMYPGVLVPAMIKKGGPCGKLFRAPAYIGLTLEEALAKGVNE